jgi:hypothetical protein
LFVNEVVKRVSIMLANIIAPGVEVRKMANSTPNQKSSPAESVRGNRTSLPVISEKTETRDALYLFACHAEWCTTQSLVEYRELLAAIDDHDCYIRTLAEELLTRSSSRPATDTDIETW